MSSNIHMAGAERIELPSKVLETPMLPLYHAPKRNIIILKIIKKCNAFIQKYLSIYQRFSYTTIGDHIC